MTNSQQTPNTSIPNTPNNDSLTFDGEGNHVHVHNILRHRDVFPDNDGNIYDLYNKGGINMHD